MKPVLRVCSTRLAWLVLLAALDLSCPASAQPAGEPPPTFAELEAAGARVGEIRIHARQIFDTEDPTEDKLLFRWANALHILTRKGVIERALLFKTGEPVVIYPASGTGAPILMVTSIGPEPKSCQACPVISISPYQPT